MARFKRSKNEKPSPVYFRIDEIRQRIGTQSERLIRADLKQLETNGLLSFSEDAITIASVPLTFTQRLLERLGQSMRRLIPVPRRMLEFLAQCPCPSLLRGILVYLLRGLSIRQGAINTCGSVKSSWVAQVADISLRAAKSVRARLIQMGWLSKDVGSTQRKLNSTGAYFRINTTWKPIAPEGLKSMNNVIHSDREFAPLPCKKTCEFAPPIEDLKTSNKNLKDQKLLKPSGVYQQAESKPTLCNVRTLDLREFYRCEALYWQAVKARWIDHSEANVLNWISAAVRAREAASKAGGDAVRIFVAIVRRKLWNTITGVQEDYARQTLARFQAMQPELYRRL
ncbi:MAG: hypothetical protein KME13_27090 [Myxacorys californica WJT36-NPBG1]|nr:hypothetical protein [Myxacorys californica WJT36-NPBG1]